jgi:hypothetical protein
MRLAVTTCPGLLFFELSEESNRSGNIVPAGIAFCPNTPVAKTNKPTSNIDFIGIHLLLQIRSPTSAGLHAIRRSFASIETPLTNCQQHSQGLPLRACQPSLMTSGNRHRAATGSAQLTPQKAFAARPASAMIDR